MRFISCILMISVLSSFCISQNIENFERLDEKAFERQLEKLPSQITKPRWEFFYQKGVEAFENESYESAGQFISKSRIIAEKLEDNFLIGKSLRFAGKIETKLFQLTKASRNFEKASSFLQQVDDSLELKLEVGYLLNDWAQRFTNPNFIHDEIDLREAQKLLFFALKIAENPNLQGSELKILTMLNIANCFGIKGNFLAQIYWLEKANSAIKGKPSAERFRVEVFSGLADANLKLGNVTRVNFYLQQLEPITKERKTQRLNYLRQLVDYYSKINSNLRYQALDQGIQLSKQFKDFNQLSEFYRTKMLILLVDGKFDKAKEYVKLIEDLSVSEKYFVEKLDLITAKAVIEGFAGNQTKSDDLFSIAEKVLIDEGNDWSNALFLFNWEAKTANFQMRYSRLKALCENYLNKIKSNNKKDFLPQIYFYLANAEVASGNLDAARLANQKAIELSEIRRLSDSAIISTGTIDKLFEIYQQRILIDLSEQRIEEGFYSSEILKSRWLTDKIYQKEFSQEGLIAEDLGKQIEEVSLLILEKPDDQSCLSQLINLEKESFQSAKTKLITSSLIKTTKETIPEIKNLPIGQDTALISYVFTSKQTLNAFVLEKGKKLQQYSISLSVEDSERLAQTIQNQIKNDVFFKVEAKEVFDKLLKPLNLTNIKHLIIIPDKALWKIPFQVLSADGKKFLIEDYQITYAPSVTVLHKFLNSPKPTRESFQVFSNSRFNNYFLLFADQEARSLAKVYGTQPYINSTIEQFIGKADQSDIIHFSMHAEIDEKEPFNSFLAFNKSGPNRTGKLTVNDLLKIKLRNHSLVFLASCATDNVLNGEGLISLAWGMMGAGASTVISAQWEANDESTQQFTSRYYQYYKQGFSGAESLQKASINMITSSNPNLNKPNKWAEFTLTGDYR